MARQLERLDYRIRRPRDTHTRPATCEEAGCEQHARGWRSVVDESTELGQRQAHYIRDLSGRAFIEIRDGGLTAFTFEAGQECFAAHRVDVERESLFVVASTARGPRKLQPDQWVDDFRTETDRLHDFIERNG